MNQLTILFFVAIGGAFGACSRYIVSELLVTLLGTGFPYGTLTVNGIGSFLMGLLSAALAFGYVGIAEPWKYLIGLGFLGALTTFSTFSMDNILLLQQQAFLKMALNIILNLCLGLFAAWLGFNCLAKS